MATKTIKVRRFPLWVGVIITIPYFLVFGMVLDLIYGYGNKPPTVPLYLWFGSSALLFCYFLFSRKKIQIHESPTKDLSNEPRYSDEELSLIADNVKTEYEAKYGKEWFQSNVPVPTSLNPKERKVKNEEAVEFLEKELSKLKSFRIEQLEEEVKEYLATFSYNNDSDVPLEPIFKVLDGMNVNYDSIARLSWAIRELKNRQSEAIQYVEKSLSIIGAGMAGEDRVNKELAMYDYMWKNLKNVRFEVDGISVETDNLIICTRGIFSLEVKNYAESGSYFLHIAKDGQWVKSFPNGKKVPIENSIVSQMNRHIALKQKVVYEEWKKQKGEKVPFVPFQPIFVIANEKIFIQNDGDLPVMRASQVYHHIMKHPEVMTEEQVNELVQIVKAKMLEPKSYRYKHYSATIEPLFNKAKSKRIELYGPMSLVNDYILRVKGYK